MTRASAAPGIRTGGLVGAVVSAAIVWLLVAESAPAELVGLSVALMTALLLGLRSAERVSRKIADERLQLSIQSAMLRVMLADGLLDPAQVRGPRRSIVSSRRSRFPWT